MPPRSPGAGQFDLDRDAERYRVYSVHLETYWIGQRHRASLVVRSPTTAFPLTFSSGIESLLRSRSSRWGLDETAIDDLLAANQDSAPLEDQFTVSVPIEIVREEETAGRRYHMLTDVGYSANGQHAVFCEWDACSDLCHEWNCVVLERDAEGGWCSIDVLLLGLG